MRVVRIVRRVGRREGGALGGLAWERGVEEIFGQRTGSRWD